MIGIQNKRRAEHLSQFFQFRLFSNEAYLCSIKSACATCMEVHDHVHIRNDFIDQTIGNTTGQRTIWKSRKHPVKVAPVGKITPTVQKSKNINYGHTDDTAAFRCIDVSGDDLPNDIHTIDFIAMDACGK